MINDEQKQTARTEIEREFGNEHVYCPTASRRDQNRSSDLLFADCSRARRRKEKK